MGRQEVENLLFNTDKDKKKVDKKPPRASVSVPDDVKDVIKQDRYGRINNKSGGQIC